MATVELSGGGARQASTYRVPIVVSRQPASSGIAAAWAGSFESDGTPSVRAGAHSYDAGAFFIVNTVRLTNGAISPAGDTKNIVVNLPPGFVGNPQASPRCPQSLLVEPAAITSALC